MIKHHEQAIISKIHNVLNDESQFHDVELKTHDGLIFIRFEGDSTGYGDDPEHEYSTTSCEIIEIEMQDNEGEIIDVATREFMDVIEKQINGRD